MRFQTSSSLPYLQQANAGIKSNPDDKDAFSGGLAGGYTVDKLPALSSSHHERSKPAVKNKTTDHQRGDSARVALALAESPSVAPMTTTFRESYRGVYGSPAPNLRPKLPLPGPYRVGSTSYKFDFCPRPLRKRTPPRARRGNILNVYPANVLFPYRLPEEIITVWKPFPVQKRTNQCTDEILSRVVSKMYVTSYQLDFAK